jgi:hypothetical protein
MISILSEERAIAAQELAEKRERAARLLAEKEAKRLSQAETVRTSNTGNHGKSQKVSGKNQTAQNRPISDEEALPGYTRVAGGIPMPGETRYWHRSGSLGYCSVRCYQDNQGNVLYTIFPDILDLNRSTCYKQNGYRDGWIVFQRLKSDLWINMPTSFLNPYEYMGNSVSYRYTEIPGEFLISMDGNRVQSRSGDVFDTPVDKQTVDLITKAQNEWVARGIGAGLIKLDYSESEVSRQLREEIDEIDRRQAEMHKKEMDIIEKRAELSRGHRTTQYKSTNVESTKREICPICGNNDQPHTHPVGDGRH